MKIDFKYTKGLYDESLVNDCKMNILMAKDTLDNKYGEGNDFLGWLTLPTNYLAGEELERVLAAAKKIRGESKALLVLGIGGSYLGAKSAIELLKPYFDEDIKIYFVGNSMSSSYIYEVYNKVKDIDFSINIISKSGSTTETSVATRLFLDLAVKKYGDKAYERVYATTDAKKGVLHDICALKNIDTFEIRDDIGGRYSVLTAVGLLPMAVAGIDIKKVLTGAKKAEDECRESTDSNALKYALMRYVMYTSGKDIEILSAFEPKMRGFVEWYKQLFAESEGKDHKGLFPTGAIFTTDLHSIGQMIQDGKRNMLETIIKINKPMYDIEVPSMDGNLDKLDFLKGMNISEINNKALIATALAHYEGGVPVTIIELDSLNEENYGYMVYFFMYACGLSAYAIGVNPFNQPGVESYKKNMFALLGKPGYEELATKINKQLEEN